MKKLLLALAFATSAGLAVAQNVKVMMKNGETVKYKAEDVEKIVFEPKKPFDSTNLLSEEYIPCDAFREWIDQNLGDGSGYYSLEQAAAYDGAIDISFNPNITDITGIEYFKNLTYFDGEDTYIAEYDFSKLTKLKKLRLINTVTSKLDCTGMTELEDLYISRNKIAELNLAANPKLRNLWCDCNQLTELNLDGCTGLETLVCSVNSISTLKLPACPLKDLAAHTNPIESLDISAVASTLDLLTMSNCKLKKIDLTGAERLTWIELSDNPLREAPDFTDCKRLETLRMENISASLGELSFVNCKYLNILRLDFSSIGSNIDLSANKKLLELSLQGCNLSTINIENCYNLGYVNVSDNNIKRLDISTADGIYLFFANRVTPGCQIKVWPDFDIKKADKNGFYTDTAEFVYEFTN